MASTAAALGEEIIVDSNAGVGRGDRYEKCISVPIEIIVHWRYMKHTASIESKRAYYSVPELAEITHESVAVWRKRILFRQIAYTKCGKNVRVSREELERWLTSRTVEPEGSR